MTTIDLLQRYSSHNDFTHHGKAPSPLKNFNGKQPDTTMPNPDPSQYFDAKTKLLHEMLDGVVKDLADSQSEPASEWEGTLWRSPLQRRARSPAYSEISDSFESPDGIEQCTNNLLSTPISPTSAQLKGPEGWPLGVEVAMNDFHRGRLSTAVLQEKELPNPLMLRKRKQQTPPPGGNGHREWQETASCKSVPFEEHGDGQHEDESVFVKPFAFQDKQSIAQIQEYGERQDHLDSASLERLASQQQRYTNPKQQADGQDRQETAKLKLAGLQQQSKEETDLGSVRIPILSARRYCATPNSLGNASSELHPALPLDKSPIGLGLENAGFQLSAFQLHSKEHDGSHTHIDDICLLNKDSPQTALSHLPPRNKESHEGTHQAESRINALTDALHERSDASYALGAFERTRVESIDGEIGWQNSFDDSDNDTIHTIGPATSKDSKADTDSDIVSWRTSGLLEDIMEESEDPLTSILALNPRQQPQHFNPGYIEPLNLRIPSGTGEWHDSMLALQGPQTEPSALSSSPPRVPPTLKLTINPSRKPQLEPSRPSKHRLIDVKSSESSLSAATVAKLKDSTRQRGRLSAAALAELRKTAESQPHFLTGPKDQCGAEIHPLLRSISSSRSSVQPSEIVGDPPLRHVLEDDDSEDYGGEEEDRFSHQITMKPRPLFQLEAQEAEISVTQNSMKEHPSSQLRNMMEERVPSYLCNDDTEGHEAEYAGTFTPQRSTLRSSNDTTLVPSLEDATPSSLSSTSLSITKRLSASEVGSPELMPSVISRPLISPSTTSFYQNLGMASPVAYNSWASTPHYHEQGTCCSATTLPTGLIATPSTSFHSASSTSRGTTMTPSSSFGQSTNTLPTSGGKTMTPSSSFGQYAGHLPNSRGSPMIPSSSSGSKAYRRSVSISSMFARYHKARHPDPPTPAMTDSMLSPKASAESDQAKKFTNDPFISTRQTTTPFMLKLKAPSKEDLADGLTIGADQFLTPNKRSSGRFSLHRRSLSTSGSLHRRSLSISGRPNTNEEIERALSTMIFNPSRSRPRKQSHGARASIDATAKPDASGQGHRRSLSIGTTTVEQKWEIAPSPTPLALRDEFSMRYRPEPLEADDHYLRRKDTVQGMRQGFKKVFGRK